MNWISHSSNSDSHMSGLLISLAQLLLFILFPFAHADQIAAGHIESLKAPKDDDECFILIRSESKKLEFEKEYGVSLEHAFGSVYKFMCLAPAAYSPPLISNDASREEQEEDIEMWNKGFINELASHPSVEDVAYGYLEYKLTPLYQKPSTSATEMLWHLSDNFGSKVTGVLKGNNVNVEPAWELGYSGKGLNILIVDDGLMINHIDFTGRVVPSMNYNFCGNTNDPSPTNPDNSHGTAVGGVAAGGMSDGKCAIGPSYEASLGGRNMLCLEAQRVSDIQIAFDCPSCHIINNSWGESICNDNGCSVVNSNIILSDLIKDMATKQRGGLGSIILFASGNDNDYGEYLNMHLYARSIYTLAIGAIEASGVSSFYSDSGPCLDAAAQSNGYGTNNAVINIYTSGIAGNESCNPGFGGTSSATPLVAGVVGLMLNANSQLTYRDIRHLFVYNNINIDLPNSGTSEKKGSNSKYWITNSNGVRHNIYYGFGAVDAAALVKAAKLWKPVSELSRYQLAEYVLRDDSGAPSSGALKGSNNVAVAEFEVTQEMIDDHNNLPQFVESVEMTMMLKFNAKANYGDINVYVISPSGTSSLMMKPFTYAGSNMSVPFTFPMADYTSHQFFGEHVLGKWKIRVVLNDKDRLNANVSDFRLLFHGVRNMLSISEPAYNSELFNECFSINLELTHTASLESTGVTYSGYLAAMTNELPSGSPVSPASTWKVLEKLTLVNDKDTISSSTTSVHFLMPENAKTYNYEKLRVLLVPSTVEVKVGSLVQGSYTDISMSHIFKFSSDPESVCKVTISSVEEHLTLTKTEAEVANDAGGCMVVMGERVSNYNFRSLLKGEGTTKFDASYKVPTPDYQDEQDNFVCRPVNLVLDTALGALLATEACTNPVGFVCDTGADLNVIQQFADSALHGQIEKLVIYTSDNIKAKFSFNLMRFKVVSLVVSGDFGSLKIFNAEIGQLKIVGSTPKGTAAATTFNSVTVSNSSIDKLDVVNAGVVTLASCYVGVADVVSMSVSIETLKMPKPYGILGLITCTGSVTHNDKPVTSQNKSVELKDEIFAGEPECSLELTADDITIKEL